MRVRRYDVVDQMWRAAKRRARNKGVPFSIRREEIIIPEHCPVLDVPLVRRVGQGPGPGDTSPSLDRLDPSLGYVPGNCVVMSHLANNIKSNATAAQVLRVALWMQAHNL